MNDKEQFLVKSEKSRREYIDILRILSCLLVIYNHTDERGFCRFINTDSSILVWIWDTFCAISCKVAVPIFFMISGAMLLGKEESLKQTYKRIPRILICLLLFSLLYLCSGAILSGNFSTLFEAIRKIISTGYWHLWYLYAYIALIISLPLLRHLVKGMEFTDAIYMFFIGIIILGLLPIVDTLLIPINWKIVPAWISESIFVYPILGYMIDKKLDDTSIRKVHICMLWGMNLLCFGLSEICEWFYLRNNPGDVRETFLSNFCMMNAVVIFITMKYFFGNKQFKWNTHILITEVGKCTFGIYLLHILFLWKLPFLRNVWNWLEGNYFGVYISCILCFGITGIVVMVIRRIPIIKKLF